LSKLWNLTPESIAVLRSLFPASGLFTPPAHSDDGSLEEPTIYRDGHLMLGIISHEQEGYLDITLEQSAELIPQGFKLHARGADAI
jgi:hypothetical protein